jgi:DNA invertase Pin-like site-specific DNA recombinase
VKVAIYMRVSTDEQAAADRFGLARQRAAIDEYVEREGHDVVAVYEDPGHSGSSAERPALSEMLHDASQRKFDAIVVYSWDRLARDAWLDGWLRVEFQKRGAQLLSATESNGISEQSKMIQVILSAVAGYERSLITARMAGARRVKASQGGYAHGQAPYGTQAVRGSGILHRNAAEWDTLSAMKLLRDQGASFRSIAATMNDAGRKPRSAAQWSHVTVRSALNGYARVAAVH